MTFPGRDMRQGTFTAGTLGSSSTIPTSVTVNCGFLPTKVELINMSAITSMAGGPPLVNPGANYLMYRAQWTEQFASASTPFTLLEAIVPSAATTAIQPITSNGISQYNGQAASPNQFSLGPKITGSTYAKASGTFTVTSTATLYPGALVFMSGFTVDKQLGGCFFTVNTVASSTTFTIANSGNWLNTASFTGGAQTFYVQLVSVAPLFYPQNAQIAYISAANPAVVTTTTNTNLSAGQQVRLRVPSAFGMTQANNLQGVVSAVSANQVTIGGASNYVSNGINTTGFTAFAWPAASAVPYTPAMLVPVGSGPYQDTLNFYNQDNLQDATINQAYQGFIVGTGVLATATTTVPGVTAGDVIQWTAWRADQ